MKPGNPTGRTAIQGHITDLSKAGTMGWKVAVALTIVGVLPLSAQRPDRHRQNRIEIPPIVVNVPEIRIAVPAMNFEFPAINIDLSNLGAEIESAVNEAVRAIEYWD